MSPSTHDDRAALRRAPALLLAGGGTGGHVFPALAVGGEMRDRGWTVSYAGRPASVEERAATAQGYPFHALTARPLVGRRVGERMQALWTAGRSALVAGRLVRRLDAAIVFSTGGYAGAPAVLGARLARRPAVLLEPNARAGAANRWLSLWATEALLAHAGAAADLACPVRLTGVPVRQEFFRRATEAAPADDAFVLVLGGSQGSRRLNELLPAAIARLARRSAKLAPAGLAVLHQAGREHAETTAAGYAAVGLAPAAPLARAPRGGVAVAIVPFIDDVAAAMGRASLVVSRAGAITLAEICAAQRPAVLVPLPLAGGHQRQNAEALRAAGAVEVLDEERATPEAMEALLASLLADAGRRRRMAEAAALLARPGAAAAIADRLEALARSPAVANAGGGAA